MAPDQPADPEKAGAAAKTDQIANPPAQETAEEPDVRFTYANERTFLAWNRTAPALIATGVATTQLLPWLALTGAALGGFLGIAWTHLWPGSPAGHPRHRHRGRAPQRRLLRLLRPAPGRRGANPKMMPNEVQNRGLDG